MRMASEARMRASAVGACANGMTGRMRPVTGPHMCGLDNISFL
jgi:hypothetical protein